MLYIKGAYSIMKNAQSPKLQLSLLLDVFSMSVNMTYNDEKRIYLRDPTKVPTALMQHSIRHMRYRVL